MDLLDGNFQVHGFASLTLVNTSDNNFFGQSDDQVSNNFSEVGLNASWRLTPGLQLSAEVLSHRAGGTDDGGVRLDYGLVDWTALSSEEGRGGIRVGRIKTAYGLYNTTRDVPFTRPSIILPQSIYFERTRNLTVSADGADIYVERYGEAGTLSASFAYGAAADRYRCRSGGPGRPQPSGSSGLQAGSRPAGHVRGVGRHVSAGCYGDTS